MVAPYVDNGNIVGGSAAASAALLAELVRELETIGFVCRDRVEPTQDYEMLGLILDGRRRVLRPKPCRTWRLWYALSTLVRRGRATGFQMRIVAGHLVHHLSLCRPALSVMRDIYPFILDHGPREAPFSSALLNELRVIRGLIPIIEGDLGRNSCLTAFCSDSSTHGYALHETRCQVSEMLSVTVWRERWRFVIDHPAQERRVASAGVSPTSRT